MHLSPQAPQECLNLWGGPFCGIHVWPQVVPAALGGGCLKRPDNLTVARCHLHRHHFGAWMVMSTFQRPPGVLSKPVTLQAAPGGLDAPSTSVSGHAWVVLPSYAKTYLKVLQASSQGGQARCSSQQLRGQRRIKRAVLQHLERRLCRAHLCTLLLCLLSLDAPCSRAAVHARGRAGSARPPTA